MQIERSRTYERVRAIAAVMLAGTPMTMAQSDALPEAEHRTDASIQPWLDDGNKEELRALIDELIADAARRQSLLADSNQSGWNNGFFLRSEDGNNSLRLLSQMEFRWILSHQEHSKANGDGTVAGFENPRTQLGFLGHVGDPSWNYFIWMTVAASSPVLDAWVRKDFDNGWSVQFGQFKLPNWQEWYIAKPFHQFLERSVLDARYRSLYSQGVNVIYTDDRWRAMGAVSDGLQAMNSAWNVSTSNSPYLQMQTEYAFTGRLEVLFGDEDVAWNQFIDFESWPGGPTAAMVGGSVHYQRGEYGDSTVENEILQWSVDGSFKFGGANLFAAAIGTQIDNAAGVDRDEYGFLVQGGVFADENIEFIARYEWGELDGAGDATGDELSILTIGVNRYFQRHNLKWMTDVGYALRPVNSAWGGASRGWRGDAPGEDGQIVIRSQMAVFF